MSILPVKTHDLKGKSTMGDYTFHKIEMIIAIPNYFVDSDFGIDASLYVNAAEDAVILGMSESRLRLIPIPEAE